MLETLFSAWWYWLVAACLLLILEILLPGIFLIWLGLGAALVGLLLLAFSDAGPAWQLLMLAGGICVAVAAGLRWQKQLVRQAPNALNQGMEAFVGRTARVSQAFHNGRGRIHLDGSTYAATCKQDNPDTDTLVRVCAVNGNLMHVELFPEGKSEASP